MKRRPAGFICSCLLGFVLCACARNSPVTDFYLLNADPESLTHHNPAASTPWVIGLGPVHIPEYLNRPQMVYEVSANQFRLDEQHRWAERLDQNILRALMLSLSAQLQYARMIPHPWSSREKIDFKIAIEILEFHRDAGGSARLTAQWTLSRTNQAPASRWFECKRPVPDSDFRAFVQSQSECLAELSTQIAAALRDGMKRAESPGAHMKDP